MISLESFYFSGQKWINPIRYSACQSEPGSDAA